MGTDSGLESQVAMPRTECQGEAGEQRHKPGLSRYRAGTWEQIPTLLSIYRYQTLSETDRCSEHLLASFYTEALEPPGVTTPHPGHMTSLSDLGDFI